MPRPPRSATGWGTRSRRPARDRAPGRARLGGLRAARAGRRAPPGQLGPVSRFSTWTFSPESATRFEPGIAAQLVGALAFLGAEAQEVEP